MTTNPTCRVCDTELNDENWYASQQKGNQHICKECNAESAREWRKANPEKARAKWTRAHRKQGNRPLNENKKCALYLGVHVAERVLRHAFKDVEVMPYGNPGYDVICNGGYMIDVKSSCLNHSNRGYGWQFNIKKNTVADYFLCLAFDNRDDLNPLHAWLLPGIKFNHLTGTGISPSTIDRWDDYQLDTSKIISCCNSMKVISWH